MHAIWQQKYGEDSKTCKTEECWNTPTITNDFVIKTARIQPSIKAVTIATVTIQGSVLWLYTEAVIDAAQVLGPGDLVCIQRTSDSVETPRIIIPTATVWVEQTGCHLQNRVSCCLSPGITPQFSVLWKWFWNPKFYPILHAPYSMFTPKYCFSYLKNTLLSI